jgi:hypothetical protein
MRYEDKVANRVYRQALAILPPTARLIMRQLQAASLQADLAAMRARFGLTMEADVAKSGNTAAGREASWLLRTSPGNSGK